MSAARLLAELERRGAVVMRVAPDTLEVDAPKGKLTPDLLADLRTHKAELLNLVAAANELNSGLPPDSVLALAEAFDERAAIMEYDGGLSRVEAEREAWRNGAQRRLRTVH